jgi:hypothetical protein
MRLSRPRCYELCMYLPPDVMDLSTEEYFTDDSDATEYDEWDDDEAGETYELV